LGGILEIERMIEDKQRALEAVLRRDKQSGMVKLLKRELGTLEERQRSFYFKLMNGRGTY